VNAQRLGLAAQRARDGEKCVHAQAVVKTTNSSPMRATKFSARSHLA
jgi:hypothetical protein